MKLQNSYKVKGKDIRVVFKRKHPIIYRNDQLKGLSCIGDDLILISPGLRPALLRHTLWHELFHFFVDEYGIKFDTERQEEEVVEKFSKAMERFERENPGVMGV